MLNEEVIAVNQDPAGHPPRLVYQKTNSTKPAVDIASSDITSQVISCTLPHRYCAMRGVMRLCVLDRRYAGAGVVRTSCDEGHKVLVKKKT